MALIKESKKNKDFNIDKTINILINRAEKDIKADELLSSNIIFKKDPLRLFLLQQASEKIIKAWFLRNLEVLESLKPYIELIKINKRTINGLSGANKKEKEKLTIIANLQESALNNYSNIINDAVGRISKNDYVGFLKKLRHNPVKEHFIKILETLSDFCKFSLLIPDGIILKYTKYSDIIKNIENIKDFLSKFVEFNEDIKKQLNIKNPKKIIEKLNQKEKIIKTDSKRAERDNDLYITDNDPDNINIFFKSENLQSIAVTLVVFFIIHKVLKMNEDEQKKLLKKFIPFINLYLVIPYFPLIAYLARFENISRYGDIYYNDYYKEDSNDIKNALVCIDDLHNLVENLIDTLEDVISLTTP